MLPKTGYVPSRALDGGASVHNISTVSGSGAETAGNTGAVFFAQRAKHGFDKRLLQLVGALRVTIDRRNPHQKSVRHLARQAIAQLRELLLEAGYGRLVAHHNPIGNRFVAVALNRDEPLDQQGLHVWT